MKLSLERMNKYAKFPPIINVKNIWKDRGALTPKVTNQWVTGIIGLAHVVFFKIYIKVLLKYLKSLDISYKNTDFSNPLKKLEPRNYWQVWINSLG